MFIRILIFGVIFFLINRFVHWLLLFLRKRYLSSAGYTYQKQSHRRPEEPPIDVEFREIP